MDSLFAEIEPLNATGVIGGIVGLGTATWTIFRQFRKDRAEDKKQTNESDKAKRDDTIAELKGLLDLQRSDFDAHKKESKAEILELRKDLEASEVRSHECDRKTDKMSSHIYYLEDTIRRAVPQIAFRPWSEVEFGSALHEPLKEKS